MWRMQGLFALLKSSLGFGIIWHDSRAGFLDIESVQYFPFFRPRNFTIMIIFFRMRGPGRWISILYTNMSFLRHQLRCGAAVKALTLLMEHSPTRILGFMAIMTMARTRQSSRISKSAAFTRQAAHRLRPIVSSMLRSKMLQWVLW